jgi:hypothetical protein
MNRITLLALVASISLGSASDPVTGPAGVYTVTTTGPTRVTSGDGWVKIEWEVEPVVPRPPDPAKPDPPPVVTPPPIVTPPVTTPAVSIPVLTGQVWMLAVYDTSKAGSYPPGQQAVLLPPDKGGSATIGPALKALQISWQPRDQADPVLKEWTADAQSKGLPAIVIIGNAGKSSTVVPLPADEAGVLALAKKIRGQG